MTIEQFRIIHRAVLELRISAAVEANHAEQQWRRDLGVDRLQKAIAAEKTLEDVYIGGTYAQAA